MDVRPSPKYIVILAIAAAVILVIGANFRPRQRRADETPAPPSESELARLARLAERRALESSAGYFSGIARDLESTVLHLQETRATAIVWTDEAVVTARVDSRFPESVTLDTSGGAIRAVARDWGPQLPVASVGSPGSPGLVPVARATMAPQSGDWVVAVWHTGRTRAVAPGHFLDVRSRRCGEMVAQELASTVAATPEMAGGGLFDVNGGLLAVILPCDDGYAAVGSDSVDAMLRVAASFPSRLLARSGMRIDSLTDEELTHFKAGAGVMVREVWNGRLAAEAGLRPGDLILTVDGRAVAGPNDLEALAAPPGGEPPVVSVQRGSKTLDVPLSPLQSPDATPSPGGAGVVWTRPTAGYRVEAVVAGSAAAKAGILSGDRVLRVDHAEPRSLRQVQQLLDAPLKAPVFVEIERNGRRRGVLLQ